MRDAKELECVVCENHIEEEFEEETGVKEKAILAFSGATLLAGLLLEFILGQQAYALFLFLLAALAPGIGIATGGMRGLVFGKRLNIEFLMTVAATGSFLIGHAEEGAAVLFLFGLAEFLEGRAGERVRRSVAELVKLAPEMAVVKRDGTEEAVHVHDVRIGDTVVVRPGERIPLDGVVRRGSSAVDQAPITGESVPAPKELGDEVYAGTVNQRGYLEIEVTRWVDETMLSRITRLVREAQRRKSPTERFVDRFSRVYTPAVVAGAILVATIPTLLFSLPFSEWVYRSLVLLVVSCPCALAISTPVSVLSGITNAARNGVLIKGGTYMEEMSRVATVAFDKTGTLTRGRLEVTDVVGYGLDREDVLRMAASLEARSEHPIADAVVQAAEREGLTLLEVDNFQALPGKGVTGVVDGKRYVLGSERLFDAPAVDRLGRAELESVVVQGANGGSRPSPSSLQQEGKTVVLLGDGDQVLGMVAVMDQLRVGALEAVVALRERGIRTVMLTGDNENTARTIAASSGVDDYLAELLPEEKVRAVRALKKTGGAVVMVGDGVNDAPALAEADVGVAMGAIGSDVALETADVALMQDDLSRIPYLFDLSKRTVRVMKENIVSSILVKGAFAVLAFPGIVTLWLAVAVGDMGLSLGVILNAMRLSRLKEREKAPSQHYLGGLTESVAVSDHKSKTRLGLQ